MILSFPYRLRQSSSVRVRLAITSITFVDILNFFSLFQTVFQQVLAFIQVQLVFLDLLRYFATLPTPWISGHLP